jgi:phosphatidylserine/phosphatidylglycerophosphate/cardiolipin synthase-like enzyme
MKGIIRAAVVFLAVLSLLPSAVRAMGTLPTGPSEEGEKPPERAYARARFLADRDFQAELQRKIDDARTEVVLCVHLFAAEEGREDRAADVVVSLAGAAARGLNVIVVLEIGREVSPITRANRAAARLLMDSGVRVYADMSGTTVHSKLAVIDRRHVFIGSHDLTQQSLGHYREASLLVESPELAKEALRFVESLEPVPYR